MYLYMCIWQYTYSAICIWICDHAICLEQSARTRIRFHQSLQLFRTLVPKASNILCPNISCTASPMTLDSKSCCNSGAALRVEANTQIPQKVTDSQCMDTQIHPCAPAAQSAGTPHNGRSQWSPHARAMGFGPGLSVILKHISTVDLETPWAWRTLQNYLKIVVAPDCAHATNLVVGVPAAVAGVLFVSCYLREAFSRSANRKPDRLVGWSADWLMGRLMHSQRPDFARKMKTKTDSARFNWHQMV